MQPHNAFEGGSASLSRQDSFELGDDNSVIEHLSTLAMDSHSFTHNTYDNDNDHDSDQDDIPEPWMIHSVNLSMFEKFFKSRPIYTPSLLRLASQARKEILAGTLSGEVQALDIQEQYQTIWSPPPHPINNIEILFLNHVELSPAYSLGPASPAVQLLRQYADQPSPNHHTSIPLVLRPCPLYGSDDHLDAETMRFWAQKLHNVYVLWAQSTALKHLRATISTAAKSCIHIRKIACFGLGDFRIRGSADVANILQYCAVFSIATALNEMYAAEENTASDREPIHIFLQDPCYMEKDRILLHRAGYKGKITLVENPDGFLQVDRHTLVVGAFLPIGVPMVQICLDIAGERGPAGFITDKMVLEEDKECFSVHDRASPRVVRMLGKYNKHGFEDHVLDEDLVKETCPLGSYWLKRMEIFLKPKV